MNKKIPTWIKFQLTDSEKDVFEKASDATQIRNTKDLIMYCLAKVARQTTTPITE